MNSPQHVYEVRPRKDHRGAALTSDARTHVDSRGAKYTRAVSHFSIASPNEGERLVHGPERSHPVERPGGKNIFTTQK